MTSLSRIVSLSKSGQGINRGLLTSLPIRQKRSLPTIPTTQHLLLQSNENSYASLARNTNPNSTRYFSSSSLLDKLKQKAQETAKSVAKEASDQVQKTASKATKSAQKAVSDTLHTTQETAKSVTNQAIQSVSQKATQAATNVTKATSQKLQSTMDGAKQELNRRVSESTTVQSISKSTKVIESGVKESARVVQELPKAATETAESVKQSASETAEHVAKSSQQLKENITSTGTKVLKAFWWWSLAAIFVYGVASTLPMQIIKFTMEQSKENVKAKLKSSEPSTQEPAPDAEPQA